MGKRQFEIICDPLEPTLANLHPVPAISVTVTVTVLGSKGKVQKRKLVEFSTWRLTQEILTLL